MSRYSERLPWSTPKNAYQFAFRAKTAGRRGVARFNRSNPTEALPDYPHASIARAFGGIGDFQYEPEALGAPQRPRQYSRLVRAPRDDGDANRIALCASTSEAYSILFKLLCNPGDEVLIPSPSYPLFEYLAKAEAVETSPYRLVYDGGWFIDLDSVRNAISERTKAIVLVNPNNPTGSFLKVGEWNALRR